MKRATLFKGLSAVFGLLFFAINGITVGMFANEGFINDALGIGSSDYDTSGGPVRYASEFAENINNYTDEELKAKNDAAQAFIEQEMEESAVLLKNDNNALPLTQDEIKKVTLLGWSSAHPYYRAHSGGDGTTGDYSLKDALTSRGFVINESVYSALEGISGNRKNTAVAEAPVSTYDSLKSTFSSYNEAAIVVLSRESGENDDLQVNYSDNGTTQSMLALTKNERDLLDMVKQYKDNGTFKKTIVLINSANVMEVDWLDDYSIDACMWIGGPGTGSGIYGVADLLTGTANPSGKLVDTFSASSLSAPAMQNYVTAQNGYNDNLIYAEGIYVGYKYYETRYEDCVLGQGNASSSAGVYASQGGSWNYADEVTYPFGYGLSYTTFTQTLDKVTDNGDGTLTATVTATNTGDVAGKSVVEIYAQTPYGDYEKTNNVEKSAIQLVAFDKTGMLEADGGHETLEITVDKYFLASYDYTAAKTYILSEGDYYLALGEDAHDALNNVLAAKNAEGMTDHEGNAVSGNADKVFTWHEDFDDKTYSTSVAGEEVTNQLQEMDWNYWNDGDVTYLSRSDWQSTYPKVYNLTRTSNMVADDTYSKPSDAPKASEVETEVDAGLKFADLFGVELDEVDGNGDNIWDKFIDQLSIDELISTTIDVKGIDPIKRLGFPGGTNDDGIDCVSFTNCYVNPNLAASSWDEDMFLRRGEFIGEDCLFLGLNTQWGPGANMHRSPFSGRNFEYLSEDSVLYYELIGSQVAGTESKGVTVSIKHFFANDQEQNRGTYGVFASEQALREIYLRPFEGAFVKGGATTTMTSNARAGFRYVGETDGLINGILHGEWDFYGVIITDAGGGFSDPAEYLAKGGNMFCFVSDKADRAQKIKNAVILKNDGNFLNILKERAKETLYTYAHTNLMNGLTRDTVINNVYPWWKSAMIAINVVAGALLAGAVTCYVLWGYVFKKGDKKEVNAGAASSGGNDENS